MYIIGLTGGIASGKNYIAELFEKKGCYVLDADKIAHDVMMPDGEAYHDLLRAFGGEILNENLFVDRAVLRRIVTDDPSKLTLLETIIHPVIEKKSRELIKNIARKDSSAIVIYHAPLLLEQGRTKAYDAIIVIWCSRKTQLERLKARGYPPYTEALKLMNYQMPFEEKQKYADYIIDNDSTCENAQAEVNRVFDLINLVNKAEKLNKEYEEL